MGLALLFGEYELTIDDKNRLLVPSEVRKSLDPDRDGTAFFLQIGTNLRPWLYPEKQYEAMVSKRESELSPEDDMLAFDHMNFSMTSKVEWDKQGRILIPEKVLRRGKIGREITMIGVRDHLELVDRQAWEAESESLLGRRAEIVQKDRQARQAAMKAVETRVV